MNTYTWQEITVSIPDDWEGKYQVREYEDGFELIQTASYEKEEGMGMLCSFNRTEGMAGDFAGVTLLAFTDTQMYYMTEPTDVNYENGFWSKRRTAQKDICISRTGKLQGFQRSRKKCFRGWILWIERRKVFLKKFNKYKNIY